jgi:hypothetical protein
VASGPHWAKNPKNINFLTKTMGNHWLSDRDCAAEKSFWTAGWPPLILTLSCNCSKYSIVLSFLASQSTNSTQLISRVANKTNSHSTSQRFSRFEQFYSEFKAEILMVSFLGHKTLIFLLWADFSKFLRLIISEPSKTHDIPSTKNKGLTRKNFEIWAIF